MKVKFSKNISESTWYKCYYIYLKDTYIGWIAKYDKDQKEYDVYSSKICINEEYNNNLFATLNEAKRYIRERIKQFYNSKGEKHE